MPLNEYLCNTCEEIFELLTPQEEYKCPKCGSDNLHLNFEPPKLSGFAAQRIRDAALRNNISGPISVTVPSNYKNKKRNGKHRKETIK